MTALHRNNKCWLAFRFIRGAFFVGFTLAALGHLTALAGTSVPAGLLAAFWLKFLPRVHIIDAPPLRACVCVRGRVWFLVLLSEVG